MISHDDGLVWIDPKHPPAGRIDPTRLGQKHPDDREPRPVITEKDWEATRQLKTRQPV